MMAGLLILTIAFIGKGIYHYLNMVTTLIFDGEYIKIFKIGEVYFDKYGFLSEIRQGYKG